MIRTIIIEDSPTALAALKQDIKDYCESIELVGEADGVLAGAKLIRSEDPDLIFLDIELSDGSGFELLEILGDQHPKVIFTTSSNEHAIQAFRFAAVDYLLKPVDPELLQEAISRLSSTGRHQIDLLQSHLSGRNGKIALNSQERIRIIDLEDIVRLESTGSYTFFHTREGEEILVTRTLKEYDQLLGNKGFIRVHQSHLINLSFVKEFIKSDGGYLVLQDGTEISVSSRKKSHVLAILGDLK